MQVPDPTQIQVPEELNMMEAIASASLNLRTRLEVLGYNLDTLEISITTQQDRGRTHNLSLNSQGLEYTAG